MSVTYFGINADPSPHSHPTKNANHMFASRFQNTAGTGIITEMGINIGDYGGPTNARLCVYADDGDVTPEPTTLLLNAGTVAITGTGWFNKTGLSLAVTLNSWYWLAVAVDGDTYVFAQSGGPTDSHVNDNTVGAYATPPSPFGAIAVDDEDQECIRAGVEAGVEVTPLIKIINQ